MSITPSVFGRTVSARRLAQSVAALAALGVAGIASLSSAGAHDFKVGDIEIEHPWSRATPPGAKTGAGYLGLTNEGSTADRLVGASSPAAPKVEVHKMSVEGGIMKMSPVAGGIEIPAGGNVMLAPGGYHLMLMGLAKPFVQGEKVPVTLTFEKAGDVTVQLKVDSIGAEEPSDCTEGDDAHSHAQ